MLEVTGVRSGYGDTEIVHGVDMKIVAGEFVCIIGPNGCGKSTLLKTILGLLKHSAGTITMEGVPIESFSSRERSKRLAYIPQLHTPPFPFTVADVVILGRTPYISGIASSVSDNDKVVAYRAMEQLGIEDLAHHVYSDLSGGQQQLVLIARALAQEPDLLIMDEPTASLDFGNQHLVLSRMKDLTRAGMSVLMVTHDPDHALFCSDQVVVMEEGCVLAIGTPEEVITTENLKRIYRSNVYVTDVILEDETRVRVCVPLV